MSSLMTPSKTESQNTLSYKNLNGQLNVRQLTQPSPHSSSELVGAEGSRHSAGMNWGLADLLVQLKC